jgi:bacillithiol biosynthesis cysteine-adding enzyme BshC
MDCNFTTLSYRQTGYFSKIILDYLDREPAIHSFYAHPVSMEGLANAIEERKKFATDRSLLVQELKEQYKDLATTELVKQNIEKLNSSNTFTICTAHQPAIFTGNLYFIYKIIHAIKLAEKCKSSFPDKEFVPVYYMGSEDADLDELGKIFLNGDKLVWDTKQTGAVGRMNTKGLEKIIMRIEGELSVLPFGKDLVKILKDAYSGSSNIQTATFKLLNTLFAAYGLVILIPDTPGFKRVMRQVFEDDLFKNIPSSIVGQTIEKLQEHYKVQANPREINLFYLKDDIRELIEWKDNRFEVRNTEIRFSKDEILKELDEYPERFSPNVILRGLFQETILPDIAFIGGGGETAYWLELKQLFAHYKVPYPVLVLRNSFLLLEKKWKEKAERMDLGIAQLFEPEETIMNAIVKKESAHQLSLAKELDHASEYYGRLKQVAATVDNTLIPHVEALQTRAIKPIMALEKKLLRAEKRKFEEQQRNLAAIKSALFPFDGLQERIDTFLPFYAKWGSMFIDKLHEHSLTVEQQFGILEISD